ncbi:MAG: M48 family metalloprotease [Pseudomonadota bacterium]
MNGGTAQHFAAPSLHAMGRVVLQTLLFLPLVMLQACTTNPVTGESEFTLMSEAQELKIGEQYYLPTQQSQGGVLKIDPALSAYVSEVGQRLAAVSDRELPYEFVVLNSSIPNAWALPGGKIAVNRGLLTTLENEAELAAVLGHEVVHAAARHTAQAQTRGMLLQGALLGSMIGAQGSDYANLIMAGASLGAQLITQRYGRDAERESDYYGIDYMLRAGYDPNASVTLQEKFLALAQDRGRNPSWFEGLFLSHPPSSERIENNQQKVAGLELAGRDLELGESRYQQAVARLAEAAPAYDLLDGAYREIQQDDLEEAMAKLRRANAMLPQEARFDGLRGDILLKQQRYREAVATYTAALAKDDEYFTYYLGRGVANARLGERVAAKADLERSAKLLPTATAAMELGDLALAGNDRAAAKEYYRVAAQAGGDVSKRAAVAYTRLDMQENPASYFRVRSATDERGRLLAQVTNASPVSADGVQIEFRILVSGRVKSGVRRIGTLASGESRVVDAGVRLPAELAGDPGKYDARVIAARAR